MHTWTVTLAQRSISHRCPHAQVADRCARTSSAPVDSGRGSPEDAAAPASEAAGPPALLPAGEAARDDGARDGARDAGCDSAAAAGASPGPNPAPAPAGDAGTGAGDATADRSAALLRTRSSEAVGAATDSAAHGAMSGCPLPHRLALGVRAAPQQRLRSSTRPLPHGSAGTPEQAQFRQCSYRFVCMRSFSTLTNAHCSWLTINGISNTLSSAALPGLRACRCAAMHHLLDRLQALPPTDTSHCAPWLPDAAAAP